MGLGGGGFITSRTYGTASTPATPSRITTRSTRNHKEAKIDRRGSVS